MLLSTNSFANECLDRWDNATSEIQQKYLGLRALCDRDLKKRLQSVVSRNYKTIGYDRARRIMFSEIDNFNGEVCSVYSPDECLTTDTTPNANIMNCEHTWPKSRGAKTGPAKSDLHHLFPTSNPTNSRRSSYRFCDVETIKWENGWSKLGKNYKGDKCFEPPQGHKGNVARAIFYFSIRYKKKIEDTEERFLRRWHEEDPVNDEDLLRNQRIEKHQRNTNPFIDQPYLVELIKDF